MSRRRIKKTVRRRSSSRKEQDTRVTVASILRKADNNARKRTNARLGIREEKTSIYAAIEGVSAEFDPINLDMPAAKRAFRWILAFLMLPLTGITVLTLFHALTPETGGVSHRFWTSSEFWYFTTGMILMTGWFFTRLFEPVFLYLYVLGHELTHAVFVLLSFGKVTDIKVGLEGGYITTNKSNILIALSPYFVPFWTSVIALIFWLISLWSPLPYHDKILYFALGGSLCFHMLWTLWMIPRDQPDLKENDTFFSLTLICLANLVLFSALLCISSRSISGKDFIYNWVNNAHQLYRSIETYLVGLLS